MVGELLEYKDVATFVIVESNGYRGTKVPLEQDDVPVIFLQDTNFKSGGFQENITADAICYPDPKNIFVIENHNRLEGMYILAPLFGVADEDAWYKVESATVNRDHLLSNTIDNVELILKKTTMIPGVS